MRSSRSQSSAVPACAVDETASFGRVSTNLHRMFRRGTHFVRRMLLDAGFVCAVALACVAPEANAEVHYEEKIEKFDILVHGKNATAIREAIRQDKPLNFGEHTIGTTTSKMSWQRRARVSGSECRLEKVDIGLSVLISVPEWVATRLCAPRPAAQLGLYRTSRHCA